MAFLTKNLVSAFFKCEFINASYFKYTFPIKNYYLIEWVPRSRTAIHNHNGKQCDFMLLNGSLTECRYVGENIGSLIEVNKIKPFQISSINDEIGHHQMFNIDDEVRWSIHKYSKII